MKKLLLILFLLPSLSFASTIKIKAEAVIHEKILKGTIDGKQFSVKMDGNGHDFMLTDWYAHVNMSSVELDLTLPAGFTAVAESDKAVKTDNGYRFFLKRTDRPVTLAISDRWKTKSINHKGVEFAVYLRDGNFEYADTYLNNIKKLYDRYTPLFGSYPYGRFAAADVPYPAGHALISLTFLSDRIISMPFIADISLGHEFVHQWAGISVETVPDAGNWAEAMTTYLADRQFAEDNGHGAQYRKNALLTVMQYTEQKEDGTCLLGFEYNSGKKAQAVGYGKGMMVFEMLKTITGDRFDDGLRLLYKRHGFKKAAWDDVQKAFEDASEKKLDGFFDGWLTETALAEFDLENLNVKGRADGFSVAFTLKNRYEWLNYPLEIVVKTEKSNIKKTIYITQNSENFSIETDDRPIEILIDPDYKTARYLDRNEVYPVMHGLFSGKKKSVFVNSADRNKFSGILDKIDNAVIYDDDAAVYNKTDNTVLFLGRSNKALMKYYKTKKDDADYDFTAEAFLSHYGENVMMYFIDGRDKTEIERGLSRLSHYGKYSKVSIAGGKAQTFEKNGENGIRKVLFDQKQGVKVGKNLSIEEIIKENSGSSAFFIGENHAEYAHHLNQLEAVKAVQVSGRKPAIGLEMVQYPYQKYLDDYINGSITEKEMLKGVEYYDRWRFDFRMYRPIFKYARENKIPLAALNTPAEITKKVSKGGLKSLSEEELKSVPADIEFSGGRYREYLHEVFSQHKTGDFANFYQAQLLWDETMAEKAADYLKSNPERTLIILAGNGHVSYKEAVPERFFRRTGKAYTAIVQDEKQRDGIADYILFPEEMGYDESPKLGVALEDKDGRLTVKEITDKSPAQKAGVKAEDVLIGFGGTDITKLSDLKLELLYAEKGREYSLAVLRNGKKTTLNIEF